ncbi:DUF6464 family protein [Calothrix sp. CCY 0018]|uniref:DUF6464 family protein n=1 Tax=Calothrix sp. CCY 0018 TaxID=3103864 RepID=UPI0039C6CA94
MLKTLLVITIGFLPSLFSLWLMRRNKARTRTLLRRAAVTSYPRQARSQNHNHRIDNPALLGCGEGENRAQDDRYYLEGVGYLVGDITCEYNARSGYIRCAVNPNGPCDGCRFYEERKEMIRTKHRM